MALKIEYLPVGKLLRYAKNSRTHSDEQVEQLVNSIREFGFTNPVLIDEKNELIAGHGRLAAAEILEMDKVPAIRLSNLSEKQKKAYRIADNKLALNAGWICSFWPKKSKR
ncbi:TPA: ParB/Srx family N-terminal domain-containing protein [Escherichia coli]